LYANRIIEKFPKSKQEITEIIPDKIQLKSTDISAYSLVENTNGSEEYCFSILNPENGLIDQNYLDEISEELSDDFNQLYNIHNNLINGKDF
jgi:hypothetical protein